MGYDVARAYRQQLGVDVVDPLQVADYVGTTDLTGPAGGLHGVVRVRDDKQVGLVVPTDASPRSAVRFAQGRALALSLLTSRSALLLDPTGTELARSARACAAELLAPAAGIKTYLDVFPAATTAAFDAVAARFGVSPLLIQHQYDNQLAGVR